MANMGRWQQFRRFWAECFPRKYSTTHHLTPEGWYASDDEIPPDRVETWKALHEQGPGLRARITWWCVWVSPSVPLAERDALRAKYPPGGWAPYVRGVILRVGEPLDRLPRQQPAEWTTAPWNALGLRQALPIHWIVILVALAALGIILAAPQLQRSYWGSYLSGKCSASPQPPECR